MLEGSRFRVLGLGSRIQGFWAHAQGKGLVIRIARKLDPPRPSKPDLWQPEQEIKKKYLL